MQILIALKLTFISEKQKIRKMNIYVITKEDCTKSIRYR